MNILIAAILLMAGIIIGWLSLLIVLMRYEHITHIEIMEGLKNDNK